MIKDQIKQLPKLPGVYIFKDKDGTIIYIGKAKSIKNRVSNYFQKSDQNWKIQMLLEEAFSLEHILTKNEDEALLLEAQMVATKKPKFNVLLKDGQPFLYFLFSNDELIEFKLVRNKKEKGVYFGPFIKKQQARRIFEFLLRKFKLKICKHKIPSGCLDFHIGNCSGACMDNFNIQDYTFRINFVKELLKENYSELKNLLLQQIKKSNQNLEFEKSKNFHNYLENLDHIITIVKTHFDENKFAKEIAYVSSNMSQQDVPPYLIGQELQHFLKLSKEVRTIDCFDISHFQSNYIVGSCIRFFNGKPEKNKFRKFKIKTLDIQNDYAALQEIVTRRYRDPDNLPDLILIDGGKGQLSSVRSICPNVPFISLAKKEEILFSSEHPNGIKLDIKSNIGKLLIALRDYAHHFAISYHRTRRSKLFL